MKVLSEEETKMYKASIGELLEHTPDPSSKKIIGAYSYTVKYATNHTKIKGFSVSEMEKCAISLGLTVRHSDNSKVYRTKDILTDRMILKIESHFEETCDECGDKYRNKITDPEPEMRCFLCMQGSHKCEKFAQRLQALSSSPIYILTGSIWVCTGCRIKNDISAPIKPVKQSVTFENNGETAEPEESAAEKEEEEADEEEEKRPSPRRDTHTARSTEQSFNFKDICELYKRNNCPHGRSGRKEVDGKTCDKPHPRKCAKYCSFGKGKAGCIKGKNCSDYHPILCKFSVRRRECRNQECTYTHLRGTNRFRTEPRYESDNNTRPSSSNETERFTRHRKDSTASVASLGSVTSESYKTPSFPRQQKRGERNIAQDGQHPRTRERRASTSNQHQQDNSFLEKLLESMKQGFSQQRQEITAMKQGVDRQMEAMWKHLNSVPPPTNQTSVPLPPLPQFQMQNQLPGHMLQIPQMWNHASMY
jgi:hypothetical protein